MAVVELNAADLARAADCARRRHQPTLRSVGDDGYEGRAANLYDPVTALLYNEIGAQGEIALARLIGVCAPLDVDTFHSRPDVPPNWNVKTQLQTSKDMLRGYLRLRRRDFHLGHRHVLVEKGTALHGRHLFVIHGWIADEDARGVAVRLYAGSDNRFVHVRHLQPVEPLCDLDEDHWAEVAARWD